jgi:flagellar biosynthesis protein FliP
MSEAASALLAAPRVSSPVDLLLWFFFLALIPVLAVTVTSFTRVVVVLGLLRAAIGSAAIPPNSVIVALALMLTGAIMAPTLTRIDQQAIVPYVSHRLSPSAAIERGAEPLQAFMQRQTRRTDIDAFARIAKVAPTSPRRVPFVVLAPAFLISELRAAFAMGFALALPFAAIDIVVAIALMSLGMFMVAPATVSLPLKLLLFVIADGWTLLVGALVASYR